MEENILEMENITKIYGNGVYANRELSLRIRKGEIHALMGENGAGKSTLMKILFGIEKPDGGTIRFENADISGKTTQEIIKRGIGMVHQHFMLVNSLKVYENVILGSEPVKGIATDRQKAVSMVKDLALQYNLKVMPEEIVDNLSVGLKQKVEILKVLARNAKLLILDEPTAVLTPQETQELFEQLLLLKKHGHTIIFISHKIREVMQICDRVTVIRRGKNVKTLVTAQTAEDEISRLMVGRDVILKMNKNPAAFGKNILEVRNLQYTNDFNRKKLNGISFDLKQGQILGVAGVEGNGQNELADCIFGLNGVTGKVLLNDKDISHNSIRNHRDSGISYIPEDRITTGLAQHSTVWENLVVDRIDSHSLKTGRCLDHKKIGLFSEQMIGEYQILCKDKNQESGMLSGGNMQKIVVARELSANPCLLIANQPTRGIDVGANEFIWNKLISYRDMGAGILLISADLNEILELSDSIMVLYEGKITAWFEDSRTVSEEELGKYMLGLKKQKQEIIHEEI